MASYFSNNKSAIDNYSHLRYITIIPHSLMETANEDA